MGSMFMPACEVSEVVLEFYINSCNNDMDGTYYLQGQTRSGRAYYKLSSANVYLYHDPSCDGSFWTGPRWIFDSNFPSLTHWEDLDGGDGSCYYESRKNSDDVTPPLSGTWTSWCYSSGGGWGSSSGYRFLEETPYIYIARTKTFSDGFYFFATYATDRGGDPKA